MFVRNAEVDMASDINVLDDADLNYYADGLMVGLVFIRHEVEDDICKVSIDAISGIQDDEKNS